MKSFDLRGNFKSALPARKDIKTEKKSRGTQQEVENPFT